MTGSPLQPRFDGPFEVVKRDKKDYVIEINNRDVAVSIDRLKPAFVVPDDLEDRGVESRNILIPIDQTNSRDGNGTNNNDQAREKTPGTDMLRDRDEESVFSTGIRQRLDTKKTRTFK